MLQEAGSSSKSMRICDFLYNSLYPFNKQRIKILDRKLLILIDTFSKVRDHLKEPLPGATVEIKLGVGLLNKLVDIYVCQSTPVLTTFQSQCECSETIPTLSQIIHTDNEKFVCKS